MTTIKVTTNAGTNASEIGDAHACDGVAWRNAVDGCDSDGRGRVFIDCDDEATAEYVRDQLDGDDRVASYN